MTRLDVDGCRGHPCLLVQPVDLTSLVWVDQRNDSAGRACAGRASGPVQVVLVVSGRIEVHHQVDIVDVDAAGGYVGGDEDARRTVCEPRQRSPPGTLLEIAVDRGRLHAGLPQLPRQPVGTVLGPDEEQRPARPAGDLGRHRHLVLRPQAEDLVVDGLDGCRRLGDRVERRVGQVTGHQPAHATVERRGEQHALAARGRQVEDGGDGGQEAEVGHVVRLVEYAGRDLVQRTLTLLDQVDEPARRGDDDVDASPEGVHLATHRGTAVDRRQVEAELASQGCEGVRDLLGELAGGYDHEAARVPGLGRVPAVWRAG